jgi:D-beta-D-heptose 7-phosphate kinase / D-beta-D-heptose 1-phosphate adenosyltransferase
MKNKKIKIIGDLMIDIWCEGIMEKKSSESPIKIYQTDNTKYSLGGAGNLCLNLKALGVDFKFFSEIGKDQNGDKILKILKKKKINFLTDRKKKITTSKMRLFLKEKQIFRQDIEDDKINKNISNNLIKNLKKKDIVVISDYKKGCIHKNIQSRINKKNCITFVDPKNKPQFYKNAFLVKPNMEKFEEWVGKFSKKKAFNLLKLMGWSWLVISHNKNGVYVFNKFGEQNFYKVKTVKNANVVGAGDIFFSGILCNYLNKKDIFSSVEIASYAASKCVTKKKIRKININDFKKKIIFTNGVFDILHKGHIDLLKFSKKLGEKLIVGINSDNSVKINKGKNRPYNNLSKRIKELKKTKLIDEIIMFDEKTPIKIIKKIKPDVIIKGNDYLFKNVIGSKLVNVILFKKKNQLSSTKLISNLNRLN